MVPNLAPFLFGVLILLIVTKGLVDFYLARHEKAALPGILRWIITIIGIDLQDELTGAVRSEPKL